MTDTRADPLSGWVSASEWHANALDTGAATSAAIQAKPLAYAGVQFRSTLEADWACTLDHYGIAWDYEPEKVTLGSGSRYWPDFRLPDLKTWIEVKGPAVPRTEKAVEYAEEMLSQGWIVLMGFTPARRSLSPYLWERYLQWNDAAGYDSRFAMCQECSAWQWLRPQLSLRCRRCGAKHQGLLATSGEMPFRTVPAERGADVFTDGIVAWLSGRS